MSNRVLFKITLIAMFALALSVIAAQHTLFVSTFAQTTSTENTSSPNGQQSTATLERGGIDLSLLQKINAMMEEIRNSGVKGILKKACSLDEFAELIEKFRMTN